MRNFKKFLALLLAALMVVSGMVTVSAAEEVAETTAAVDYDATYEASAKVLNELDILKGNGIDFDLDAEVQRYQMALFIARIMTGETSDSHWSLLQDNTTEFDDVTEYYGAISLMAELNIIKGKGWIPGVGDNCFDPCGKITYAHALTMANRAYGEHQWKTDAANIEAAKTYGLTDGLNPNLKADDALTRGEVVQILYNLLFAVKNDGTSYAEKNFGMTEDVYVVVATNQQHMLGFNRVAIGEDIDSTALLALLNDDGTYSTTNVLYATDDILGADADVKLGYSYTVRSYADGEILVAEENASKKFQNYGDTKTEIKSGDKYSNALTKSNLLKVDGKTYSLVEAYTDSTTNYYGELIVHSMFAAAADSEFLYYVRDNAGNILSKEDYSIAIYYNMWTDTYSVPYKVNGEIVGYYPATDEDFAKCAYTLPGGTNTEQFGIETNSSNLTTIQFSELTMIDDDGDGKYDRGIYIPYSVGMKDTDDDYDAWIVTSSKEDDEQDVALIGGVVLGGWATNTSGVWGYRDAIRLKDIQWTERPADDEYIVYYYNPYTLTVHVVENLGKAKSGTAQTMTQGTYAYDSTTKSYYYNGATVTIDGETYKLGYRTYQTNSQLFKATNAGNTDLNKIDSKIATSGYDTDIYGALLGQTYGAKMKYVVLAGRVIYASSWSNSVDWMAFNPGEISKNAGTSLSALLSTKYENGDILGLSDDNYIQVAAYTDKSGEKKVAKIATINGYDYGSLVMTYGTLMGGMNNTFTNTLEKVAICKFFTELGCAKQYVYIVTGQDEKTGAYHIDTGYDLYKSNTVDYIQPAELAQASTITFINGIATAKVKAGTGSSTSALILDKETKIVVAGVDGVKVATGIPEARDGSTKTTLKITGPSADIRAFSLTKDFILVVSATKECDYIYSGEWDSTASTADNFTYYMVMGRSSADNYDGETTCSAGYVDGKVAYTYKNIYNINAGKTETITVVGGLDEYDSAYGTYYNQPKPIGAIYAYDAKNDEYTLLTTELADVAYVSGAYVIDYKYAVNSTDVFEDVVYSGFTAADGTFYPAVLDGGKKDTLGAAAPTGNAIVMTKDSYYDTGVSFKYDVITYSVNLENGTADVRLTNNDRASTYNHKGNTIYYVYEEGESFVGYAVKKSVTLAQSLDDVKADAIADLTEVAGTGAADALAAAIKAVNAATTKAAVETAVETHTELIKAALKAEATVLAITDGNTFTFKIATGKIEKFVIATGEYYNTSVVEATTRNGNDFFNGNEKVATLSWENGLATITLVKTNAIGQTLPVLTAGTDYGFSITVDGVAQHFTGIEF